MCVFCNGFRNRINGYEEFDDKAVKQIEVNVGIMMSHSKPYLMVRINDQMACMSPISFCPKCGAQLDKDYTARRN